MAGDPISYCIRAALGLLLGHRKGIGPTGTGQEARHDPQL